MALVCPDYSERQLLRVLLGLDPHPGPFYYRLYKNDVTPSEASLRADFQESSAPGYSPQSIPNNDWSVATDAAGVTTATASTRTWSFTAGETVYGYIVTGQDGVQMYWCERFAQPIVIPAGGAQLDINPSLSLD